MVLPGFSEPESGSDLASMQTRAVRDGDDYVINGQKIWTSNAHIADRMMLLARTNPDVPKHKGISAFIVDMKSPGISVQGIDNIAYRHDFNGVFRRCACPREEPLRRRGPWLVCGDHHAGLRAVEHRGHQRRAPDNPRPCALGKTPPGGRPRDKPEVRNKLADLALEAEIGRLVAYRTVWLQARGEVPNYEASIGKLWMAFLGIRVANTGVNLMGAYGQLQPGSPWAQLHGRVLTSYLLAVSGPIGGGTSEVQKNIIATRGLGLPR